MSEQKYFDLHTQGLGYVNRVRKVRPKHGQAFIACDVAALHGPADNVSTQRFDCRASGAKAIELIQRHQRDVDADRKVLIGFRLGDLWIDTFTYRNGDKAGETGVALKARLIYIGWIKVDGELVYTADSESASAPVTESQDQTTPETEPDIDESDREPAAAADDVSMPTEVALSKDDPDFLTRKASLQQAGYRFDGQNKIWRLS